VTKDFPCAKQYGRVLILETNKTFYGRVLILETNKTFSEIGI